MKVDREAVYDELYKKADKEELKQLGKLLDEHIDWEKGDGLTNR